MNCTASEANCETQKTFAPKKPALAEEKPGDSPPSLLPPPHREPSKSIAPTPIHPPLSSVIWIRGIAVGQLVCRKRQQRKPAKHRRELCFCRVPFRQDRPSIRAKVLSKAKLLYSRRQASISCFASISKTRTLRPAKNWLQTQLFKDEHCDWCKKTVLATVALQQQSRRYNTSDRPGWSGNLSGS